MTPNFAKLISIARLKASAGLGLLLLLLIVSYNLSPTELMESSLSNPHKQVHKEFSLAAQPSAVLIRVQAVLTADELDLESPSLDILHHAEDFVSAAKQHGLLAIAKSRYLLSPLFVKHFLSQAPPLANPFKFL